MSDMAIHKIEKKPYPAVFYSDAERPVDDLEACKSVVAFIQVSVCCRDDMEAVVALGAPELSGLYFILEKVKECIENAMAWEGGDCRCGIQK
jgi:hypothetical protein